MGIPIEICGIVVLLFFLCQPNYKHYTEIKLVYPSRSIMNLLNPTFFAFGQLGLKLEKPKINKNTFIGSGIKLLEFKS